MKKYFRHFPSLIITLALIFAASGFVLPQTVKAQTGSPCPMADGTVGIWYEGKCVSPQSKDIAPWWNILAPLTWLVTALGAVSTVILQLADYVVGLSGVVLNFVVQYTVVNMGARVDASSVNNAWSVIRDISNMGFIFVLLYAAIMTIVGQGEDNQKLIVKIVIVAILVNFSLFFTKFVIDVSNILAVMFYDAIAPGALNSGISWGLSNSLMQNLQLQSIFDIKTTGVAGERLLIIGVMGTILALIAAFVFFAISILLIIRFVVLIFVLILSPLMFVSLVLPNTKEYTKQWWDALSGQAFFAPIYFMLTWIVIVVSRGLFQTKTGGSMAEVVGASAATPSEDSVGILVNFIIMIALLIASLTIAKTWASRAGPAVSKLTSWATGKAGAVSLGAAGWAGRKTVGSWGGNTLNDEQLKARARQGDIGARLKLATANKMAKSSFDMRATGIGTTLGAGKAQKGGWVQDQKDLAKRFEKYKPSGEEIKKAKEREEENQKKLDTLAEKAIPKTDEHTAAERELESLRRSPTKDLSNEAILARKARIEAAQEEVNRHKEELEKSRKQYVETSDDLDAAEMRARRDTHKEYRQSLENSMENMAKASERREPQRIIGKIPIVGKKINWALKGTGYIVGGKDRATAIRAAAKGKSKKEKLAEAAAELAKEEVETAGEAEKLAEEKIGGEEKKTE